jgi:hypothetical protein
VSRNRGGGGPERRHRLALLSRRPAGRVVAVVPAKNNGQTVGATVHAVAGIPEVDEVVVVDDASSDMTGVTAAEAGARVVSLAQNRGKGGAMREGLATVENASVLLFIDADTGESAASARLLLEPVLKGEADLAVGILPAAGRRGGFGIVRKLAAWGIEKACGFRTDAPLSGQRAVRADLLREMELEEAFGLETAMTIDAVRAGMRVVEVRVEMTHEHRGRGIGGFIHRARQLRDVLLVLWARIPPRRVRVAAVIGATLAIATLAVSTGGIAGWTPPLAGDQVRKVLIFSIPYLSLDDLSPQLTPELWSLTKRGAVGAMSIRTGSPRPSLFEAYTSIGAGNRVKAGNRRIPEDLAGLALDVGESFEGGTAGAALERRVGITPDGAVVHLGVGALQKVNATEPVSTQPGAFGQTLREAGLASGVVGSGDLGFGARSARTMRRAAAASVMDASGVVGFGTVSPSLLVAAPDAPFGVRADAKSVVTQALRALDSAAVVLVDPGDTTRAAAASDLAFPEAAEVARLRAVKATDQILGEISAMLPEDAALFVIAPVPSGSSAALTPAVAVGPGIPRGLMESPSTKRRGLVTLTDLAATVLDGLGLVAPGGMAGSAWGYVPDPGERVEALRWINAQATVREDMYLPATVTYIAIQVLTYVLAFILYSRGQPRGKARRLLRGAALVLVAFAPATFLLRLFPLERWGPAVGAVILVVVTCGLAAIAATRTRRPLSGMGFLLGATAAILILDVVGGSNLQSSSLLGYSPLVAGRFHGLGNTAFALLGASAVLLVGVLLHFSRRKEDALWAAAAFLALVVLIDAHPNLGSDVGGLVTLVPAFGVSLMLFQGRRLTPRRLLALAGLTVVALAAVTVADVLRAAGDRTHLGRIASQVPSEGWSLLGTMLQRKARTNLAVLRISAWTWLVPIGTVFLLYLIVRRGILQQVLPPISPLRAATVGALTLAVLGSITNDSGIVISAMVLALLLPFLVYATTVDLAPAAGMRVMEPVPDISDRTLPD